MSIEKHPDGVEPFNLDELTREGETTVLELDPTKFAMVEMSNTETGEFQGFGLLRPGIDEGPLLLSFDQRVIEAALIALVLFYTSTIKILEEEGNKADPSMLN